MRPSRAFAIVLLILAGSGFYCKRSHEHPGQLVGRQINDGVCGNVVIQIISGNFDPSKVIASWKNPTNDSTYSNVFAVSNPCNYAHNGIRKGQRFNFQINDSVSDEACAHCEIFVPVPSVSHAVVDVQPIQ